MKVIVTGSEGTLGKPLVKELERRGHSVFGLDIAHSHKQNVKRVDVSNARQVYDVFDQENPDMVYHLAAEFGRVNGEHYFEQLWNTNQIGTANIINACVRNKAVSRFVLASSSEAYGDTSIPYLQESWLDEHAPFFHNQYALSKWAQEQQTYIAAQNRGLNAVILRFFNAYGEGEFYSPYRSVVCLFCYRLMHGLPITVYKNYHRVFMHVDDWANTVANVADRFDNLPKNVKGVHPVRAYNVGGTEYRSVEEMVNIIMDQLVADYGYNRAALRDLIFYQDKEAANVTNKRPDVSRAQLELGHNPTIALEAGISRTLRWMKDTYAKN